MQEAAKRVVIIGGGQAGGEAASRLRAGGFEGEITLVGEEPLPPYQRPPLSKKYLSGELELERLLLRPQSQFDALNVHLLLSRRANWIDRAARRVRLEGGQELPYDALILATGARARTLALPGADLGGVHVVRTVADIEAMRPHFLPGARLVVVGAGYIGLEAAAVARTRGLEVSVLEAGVRPLARVTSEDMSGFFLDEHTAKGVRFELSSQAAVFKGTERVRSVGLTTGAELRADLVIIGVGAQPETTLAEKAQLAVDDGIIVDRGMKTSDPAIWAIGDCVRRPLVHYGMRLARLESVHNALEGARIAAAGILGQAPPKEEAPWFWSDQYDLKLTIAGVFNGYDSMLMRGTMAERAFSLFYFEGERLLAVDAVNRPADYLAAKQIIQDQLPITKSMLADGAASLRDLIAAARAGA